MAGSGGWYGVLAVMQQQREIIEQWREIDPIACPNDGTLLKSGPNGELFCPFDGWQWDGSANSAYPSPDHRS